MFASSACCDVGGGADVGAAEGSPFAVVSTWLLGLGGIGGPLGRVDAPICSAWKDGRRSWDCTGGVGALGTDAGFEGGVSMSMALSSSTVVLPSVLCVAVVGSDVSGVLSETFEGTKVPFVCGVAVDRLVAGPNGLAGVFGRFRFVARVGERDGGGG